MVHWQVPNAIGAQDVAITAEGNGLELLLKWAKEFSKAVEDVRFSNFPDAQAAYLARLYGPRFKDALDKCNGQEIAELLQRLPEPKRQA